MIKGEVLVKPTKERSPFEQTFLRAVAQLTKVQKMRAMSSSGLVFNAYRPPFPIVPLNHIINIDQQGTKLVEQTRTTEHHTLWDLLSNCTILSRYAALILGADSTTGFGKTQFALRLACEWSKAMAEDRGLSKDAAQVCFMNSLDAAKDIEF